jgi:peptidoglycan/xylan/chitin deacetylase (PgdA/CDA1 family)
VELFIECYNLTNHVNDQPFTVNMNVISPGRCSALLCAGVAILMACGGCGRTQATGAQPPQERKQAASEPTWKWSDQRIGEFWSRVGAGPALKPANWPGGAVVAVALSFDYQMGTIYDDKNPASAVNTNSQYDGRVGLPRLLRLLDKYSVPASFFTTAVTAAFYPDTLKQIMASGRHEIGVHGWIHERNPDLPPDDERRLLEKSITALQAVTGKRPVGYRSPAWENTPNTLKLLREFQFLYDSSMMADDEPYEVLMDGKSTGVLEVPVEWVRDDAVYYSTQQRNPVSPSDVLESWKAEFDKAYEEHGLFETTMHPRISRTSNQDSDAREAHHVHPGPPGSMVCHA